MAIFLTSQLNTHYKDENGNRISIPLEDENKFLTNLRKHLKKTNRIVYVANNPNNIEENDIRVVPFFDSFEKTGFHFKEKILLDRRNKSQAKEILSNADLIILSGGKCLCELNFFNEIGLKEILKNFDITTIGISAGSMNLCKIVNNFPEELVDMSEPRWLNGLEFYDGIIIPHFDGKNKKYQFETEIDLINDYVLPMSKEKEFLGIPNGSYILIDKNKVEYYGDMYKISNGKVKKHKG